MAGKEISSSLGPSKKRRRGEISSQRRAEGASPLRAETVTPVMSAPTQTLATINVDNFSIEDAKNIIPFIFKQKTYKGVCGRLLGNNSLTINNLKEELNKAVRDDKLELMCKYGTGTMRKPVDDEITDAINKCIDNVKNAITSGKITLDDLKNVLLNTLVNQLKSKGTFSKKAKKPLDAIHSLASASKRVGDKKEENAVTSLLLLSSQAKQPPSENKESEEDKKPAARKDPPAS